MWHCELDSSALGQESATGCCEHSGEPLMTMIGGEFCNSLSAYELLKDFAVWSSLVSNWRVC